ncbi:hypothetical protein BCH_01514 [Brucella sp. 191011898]|nr:hypothetical protein BCH_01514 [Brucella sp. 191011898]
MNAHIKVCAINERFSAVFDALFASQSKTSNPPKRLFLFIKQYLAKNFLLIVRVTKVLPPYTIGPCWIVVLCAYLPLIASQYITDN